VRIRALALGALCLAGCGAAEPAGRPDSVREVIEIPVRNAEELRWHFGAEMARAGYPEAWPLPADAAMLEGYVPQGTPGGWTAELVRREAIETGYRGLVGIVRRRLRQPALGRPELAMTVEVAQRSCLDAHFLLLNDWRLNTGTAPLDTGDAQALGDAATARMAKWDGRDAAQAISHLSFVRRNVRISLAWAVAREDRAADNDRRIIDAARAIDAQLTAGKPVAALGRTSYTPRITELVIDAEGPLHAAPAPGPATDHHYVVKAAADPRNGGPVRLTVTAGGPGRKLWDGPWGGVFETQQPGVFEYVPGPETGTRELWAFAVNAHGLVGEKKLAIEIVPPASGADDG
jgi:hypothetical protein